MPDRMTLRLKRPTVESHKDCILSESSLKISIFENIITPFFTFRFSVLQPIHFYNVLSINIGITFR